MLLLGLADPGPVAEALWTDDELEAAVHLDAIITVVDAKHIQQQLQQHSSDGAANEAQKQIAYADSVLLNKVSGTLCLQSRDRPDMYSHQRPSCAYVSVCAHLISTSPWNSQNCFMGLGWHVF